MAEPNLGELIASTDEKREKTVADFVSNANVLYHVMKKYGNVKEDAFGRQLYEPFKYDQNDSYQAIDPTEEISLAFNRTLDVFTYSPKQSVVAVMISEVEKAQNRGPAQVLNLIKERSAIGEETMVNEICTDLNGDGTGRSSKAFAGIRSYISDSGAATVGGVSMSTYTAVANAYQNLTTSPFSGATTAGDIEDKILYLKNQICSFHGNEKFIGYMGSAFYRLGATALRSRQRLVDEELASAGFKDHLVLEGIPFFLAGGFNPQSGTVIATDRFYILNPKGFKFRTYPGYNMQALPTQVSTRQLVDVALRVCFGQFTCSDPARNAVGFDS